MGAWLNGEFVDRPMVPANGAGCLIGRGVFTTIGVYEGRPWFASRHYTRLKRDGEATGIPLIHDQHTVLEALQELIRREDIERGLARFTLLARGDGRWSTEAGSDLLILTTPGESRVPSDAKLLLSSWRPDPTRPLARVKLTSYLPYILAWQEAHTAGFDDALLLNSKGEICECARASLMWRSGDRLFTSALRTGCLDGLGAQIVRHLAQELRIDLRSTQSAWEDLLQADEVFTVSAAMGIRRVESVSDGTKIQSFGKAKVIPILREHWQRLALSEA